MWHEKKHKIIGWSLAVVAFPIWCGTIALLVVGGFAGSFVIGRWAAKLIGWY